MCGRRCERTVHGPITDRLIHIVCDGCGFEFDEAPRWAHTAIGPHDPHVGLPLHFQRAVLGHTLWAYNREHLVYLRDFIGATNRVREPNRNSSLASRLPDWMKAAKHREPILHAAEKMLRDL